MRTIVTLLLFFAGCNFALGCPCGDVKPQPPPASINRAAGIKFTHTAAYRREFQEAVASARRACEKNLHRPNVAIVADIDETLLDNREVFITHPDFNWDVFWRWLEEARAPVLKPTADLLKWARKNGMAIFLVTGRYEHQRAPTINNLVKRDVAYDGLFMRPDGNDEPAEAIKARHREAIEKMGFKIVVNIGDQYSDLTGGHAEDCEKLPNKIYYIP